MCYGVIIIGGDCKGVMGTGDSFAGTILTGGDCKCIITTGGE